MHGRKGALYKAKKQEYRDKKRDVNAMIQAGTLVSEEKRTAKKELKKLKGEMKKISPIRKGLKYGSIIAAVLTVTGGVVAYSYIHPLIIEAREEAYDKLASIGDNTFTFLSNTTIYDKDNNMIAEIVKSNYEYTEISEVPEYIQNGYIAVEDKRFLKHNGIDYISLCRASLALIINRGEITQGGSTITQQVIKNMLLTQEQTYKRKLIEFFIAPELEKQYSKAEIMEYYVNTCYYGNGCYGIGSAASFYFGKLPKQLTLGECALLVGLSNNPSKYNPVNNPDAAKSRRNVVLTQMLDAGAITQEQFNQADAEELNLVLERTTAVKESYQTSYAIHCATLKLMELNNFDFQYVFYDEAEYDSYKELYSNTYSSYANEIRAGGYTIYTSLDSNLQNSLQYSIDNGLNSFTETDPISGKYLMQGAGVVIDNSTGYVAAIVGGRGTDDEYNRGFLAERQPGSTMKPIGVYGPAMDTGRYYPSLIMTDKYIEGGPQNYVKGSYSGNVTLRYALARSINTIPFQILMDIQPSTALEYLGKMRFDTLTPADNNGSLALGGMTYGVRVCDLAKAYYTIQNKGIYSDNNCLTKLDFQSKGTLYEDTVNLTQIYEPDVAYLLTDMLKTVATEGTGVSVSGHPTGAKTGTTSDDRDSWYAGFTKQYTTVVWVGYDTPREIPGLARNKYALNIWLDFMNRTHETLPAEDWEKPESVVYKYVDGDGKIADYDTGKSDLFSQTLIDRLEEQEKQKEAERLRAYAQEWADNDEQRQELAEGLVTQYETTDGASYEDFQALDDVYRDAQVMINLISNSLVKNDLSVRLELRHEQIRALRKPYDDMKAAQDREAEEQAKAEQEAENKRIADNAYSEEIAKQQGKDRARQELIEHANTTLAELENYSGVDSHSIELYLSARSAVKACSGYTEYDSFLERLESQEYKLHAVTNTEPPQENVQQEETVTIPAEETAAEEEGGNTTDNSTETQPNE